MLSGGKSNYFGVWQENGGEGEGIGQIFLLFYFVFAGGGKALCEGKNSQQVPKRKKKGGEMLFDRPLEESWRGCPSLPLETSRGGGVSLCAPPI